MGTFSFKEQFVNPIRMGLGLPEIDRYPPAHRAKHQTVRAERKDLRRPKPTEELHLFTQMRTRDCFRIAPRGLVFARDTKTILLRLNDGVVMIEDTPTIDSTAGLNAFARNDGFEDWDFLKLFWSTAHPGVDDFGGFITFWNGRP